MPGQPPTLDGVRYVSHQRWRGTLQWKAGVRARGTLRGEAVKEEADDPAVRGVDVAAVRCTGGCHCLQPQSHIIWGLHWFVLDSMRVMHPAHEGAGTQNASQTTMFGAILKKGSHVSDLLTFGKNSFM